MPRYTVVLALDCDCGPDHLGGGTAGSRTGNPGRT